jgi:hypothetical protein
MTYTEFIQGIITTRGQWNIAEGDYYEVHHIVPKCLGGLPKRANKTTHNSNIIWLYPQEHFIAHKLLAEENSTNVKLTCAFIRMCYSKNADYAITAEEYAEAKKLQAEAARINSTGKNNPMYGKYNKGSLGKRWSLTDEQRRLHSISAAKLKKPVRCVELELVFESASEAARYFKASTHSGITRSLKTGRTACGYHWQYVN